MTTATTVGPLHGVATTGRTPLPAPAPPVLRTGAAPDVPVAAGADPADALLDVTGLRLGTSRSGRPLLLRADGTEVDTWREGYPYPQRMPHGAYHRDKRLLQIELLKLQQHLRDTGQRLLVVFEGRDASGKGGSIKRFTERLDPRGVRVVALPRPTERERGQWYFQRYLEHLPAAGEIVLFDRSWYNRAGVERVMGFCDDAAHRRFTRQVPLLEEMLVEDGLHLVKLWFSVTRAEQRTRFLVRRVDPVRRWKLSPVDLASLTRWDDYSRARDEMFALTHTPAAPWTVVNGNDKERARLAAMRHVLSRFEYPGRAVGIDRGADPLLVGPPPLAHLTAVPPQARPPRETAGAVA